MHTIDFPRMPTTVVLRRPDKPVSHYKFIDIEGKTVGKLHVLSYFGKDSRNKQYWLCKCECGEHVVTTVSITEQKPKSCGCLRLEVVTRHGMSRTKEYQCWIDMLSRCCNNRNARFKDYGGRGVSVCQRWIQSFENFIADMGVSPGVGYSIERKDNNGNYEPGNCCWATSKQQARNRRDNSVIEINGERKTVTEWCEHFGVERRLAYSRIGSFGWPPEIAVSRKSRTGRPRRGETAIGTKKPIRDRRKKRAPT